MMQLLLYLLLASFAAAQFNQRWEWRYTLNANGQWVTKAHWRPDNDRNTPHKEVQFPSGVIELEYNCRKMPAICQNVRNWHNDPALSSWHTSSPWAGWFTYDLGSSDGLQGRGNRRRSQVCPDTWKGTIALPRCPEPNQPRVVPPLYDANGFGVTALVPQPIPGETELRMVIADGRDNPFAGQLQSSGRRYTCDEFPPASWIEGGVGLGANSASSTTYCAPSAFKCESDTDARGSEQNWQGFIHGFLGAHLEARLGQDGAVYDEDTPVAFRFHYEVKDEDVVWAARITMDREAETNTRNEIIPGTPFTRRGEPNKTRSVMNFLPNGNGSLAIEFPNGEVFRTHERGAKGRAHKRWRELALGDFEQDGFNMKNDTESPQWHITAEDIDPELSTYGLQTQQDPIGAIDIIEWSKQIILGQIGTSNNATNETFTNNTAAYIQKHSQHVRHAAQNISPYRPGLQKRVDGPIQCGPGQPCLDESCCSKEGKCGYKAAQCAPENCLSNCDAKAMCGIDSADGKNLCGLKLCCSYYGWCGTEDVHCKDPEPLIGKTPCQQGFGSCEIKPTPLCGKGSGTSKGRRIGYYQGWNTRERVCDKVTPRQINTRGLSHLLYAFAFFHPESFEMMPMNSDDVHLYGEFTALKRNGLQTWIAIGGWSFNDPGTETYNAYTDMVSTEANRRAFIQSLIKFMDTYGFQGADIDWEYPAEPKRGGRKEDTDNLVLLMKEMKEQFGGRFGSSLTLAPDYWYLRGFKPADMQKHVDWMGFMSYDLHGPWDTDVKTLGSRVRPQTDITEIEKNLKPLWFDGVDPSKIVMGLAYYGRTYTLADASCGKMGCSFIPDQGGAAGSCTNFPGVLSNREIKRIIKDEKITPYLNETAMVKYFTYQGNSWVGYDDADTYAMKEAFANEHCLGGIMIWSIDFDDETGVGLGDANKYKSPDSATVIPMAHTTVPRGETFTLNSGAATDVPRLPNNGNQNSPEGPGAAKCEQCSFFRLITSTCCGTGGSVGNPVLIPAGVPTPMDIPLPAGFTPGQSFKDPDGNTVPADQPLPKETVIPRGTVFSQPFVIGPGSSLREGEGEDQNSNSSNLVWLSPSIWEDPNPQVQCFFPCTFVLPPYTSFTTTVNYPRITVTESGSVKTTLTFPPLTVSSWAPTTIVVDGRKGCTETGTTSCTNVDDNRRTSSVQISSSTTWPYVTYTSSGTRRTTRPEATSTEDPDPQNSNTPGGGDDNDGGDDDGGGCKLPFPLICPPPPPRISIPLLTISHGPPKPTTAPCSWPTLNCPKPGPPPGPGPTPSGHMSILPPAGTEEEDEEEEDEEEEEYACAIRPRTTKTVGVTVTATSEKTVIITPSTTTTTTKTSEKPSPPAKTPEFNNDKKHCYDGLGQWTRRARMIDSADKYCEQSMKGHTLTEKWNPGEVKREYSKIESEIMQVEITAFVEVVPGSGCEWKVDINECKTEFRKIIDKCDEDGENRKQGGTLSGDCLNWRLDPNRDYS